jgi:polysaccharide export outer membrane protein
MIRANGKIAFPLIGDVQAAGLSPSVLAADLTIKLSRYLNEPRITIRMIDRTKE